MPGLLQRFPYFLCGGKESKCRPAQGQRLKHRYETADARAKTVSPREGEPRMPTRKPSRPARANRGCPRENRLAPRGPTADARAETVSPHEGQPRMPTRKPSRPAKANRANAKNTDASRTLTERQKPKNCPQGKQLHVSRIAAIVAGMALSKFPFLSLQASAPLLGELALARLPR